ncbi:MAG: response regulator [Ignavibacteriae bacterium]|nr:response regulator [Ignavibacteriota bacterium]MCB9206084.1 response regulator [Ignavibacteriales bacterium]MCB9209357.1 response regulator [Ignavibacteriales bacterium]MCB9258000.1 response regulator [Ignavibacteriales bacterium]
MTKKNKIKVLIIDDNYSILEYLKTLLRRYNFEIKTSSDGYEGLQEVAEFKPDIIFLDLMMPNIDGLQMLQLKKVLNEIKDIPVIVISANAGRNNVLAAIEAGADRVLSKPINVKQLKSAVDELLGGSFFELVNNVNEIETDENINSELNEKFEEYKTSLIEAIKLRNAESIRKISVLLQNYCNENNNIKDLLKIIEEKKYEKPSDWMFAEMKIKEIEQNIKTAVNHI